MENSYGIGVVNRYALFLEDEADPLDALRARELDRERKRKNREAEKENKPKTEARPAKQQQAPPPAAPQPAAPARRTPPAKEAGSPPAGAREPRRDGVGGPGGPPRPQQPRTERPPQQRRPYNGPAPVDGEQQPRPPRREFAERRPNNNYAPREPREPREGEVGERRGGAARGGGRGRGTYEGRGKREFDRRSGSDRTGVKPVDKRDGGGSHNWGSHKDDLEDFNKTQSEGEIADPEKTEVPVVVPTEPGKEAEEEAPAAPTEEEAKEFTLDEWKAIKGSRQKPQYNLRKAGEGEDLSQWKDMVVLQKPKVDGEDSDDEYESAEFPQRVGRQKRVEGIEFTFYENRRGGGGAGGRGGRGGRGGGRGRGGGPRPQREDRGPVVVGGEKPQNARQNAPKVNDNKDFPSLG